MATKDRIKKAVDDDDWREFRLALKGQPTDEKLKQLRLYYEYTDEGSHWSHGTGGYSADLVGCNVCIRVDNYIKALCRGGQLNPGASLLSMTDTDWSKDWIKR